ncbi:MAG: hypothetical protein OER95_09465, partial [Acidimicrobiia bacterium]|nr:hypothetical protein [Acidimicrobiia bacterium]
EIHGYGWEEGVEVTVAVDDPGTPANPDWTDTRLAVPADWDPSTGFVQFQPFVDDFVIEPGFVVTMTQLGITTTHVVTSLEVTDVNPDTDVVSGVGDEGALITVSVWDDIGTWREVTVTGGTWSADFSVAGPGGVPVDITRGTAGEASQTEVDNNSTQWTWWVPNPAFSVETPNSVWSVNDGWVPGRTVTVIVDDDPNPGDDVPLFQTTTPVTSWGPRPWEAGWNINNLGFTIAPGHYVTVDDGVEVTKTLQVAELTITAVDETNDLVSGTAVAGAQVEVNACEQFLCGNRTVTADAAGTWVADFAVPGPGDHEQDVIDIQSGIGGAAQIVDADGDSTHRGWHLQEPYFGVDVIHEEMWAVNWPAGETLTFQVYADDTATDLLWTDTMTVYGTPWQNTEAGYRFWSEFDVAAGQYFTVSDGVITKELVVSTLTVTAVDPGSDVYTGTVDPTVSADVTSEVCAWARRIDGSDDGLELCDLPDPATGEWTIDFAGVGDIIPGDHLGAYQRDADGDETSHAWHVPPWIYVELAEQDEFGNDLYPDRVHLDQWTGPVDIYLGVVRVLEGVVTNGGHLQVDLEVEIGQTIRVVDAVDDKSLYIDLLTADDVTAWDDPVQPSTAFGTAAIPDYSRQVQVTATAEYGWWTERWVPVVGGQYQADFANPGNGWRESEIGYFGEGGADDIYLGGEVRANLWDSDNDQVQAIWHTCNPRIIVVRGNDRIEAVCFPVGSELVVELDDPATGVGIDWSSGAPVTVTRNPDKPWETLVVFELGEYAAPDNATVTATASEGGVPVVEVTTEVIPFTIDVIDEDAETITGTAPAGSEVLVEADGNWRYPIADGTNIWVANFSEPGDRPGEENPVDLRPGVLGGATLIDEAGSATTIAWRISNPIFEVYAHDDWLWGNDWLPDTGLTITVDQGAGPVAVPGGPYSTDGEGNFDVGFDSVVLDLAAGDVVEVSDGESTKSHTITSLAVTSVDADNDVISGTGTAGGFIDVWIHDTNVGYTLLVDEFGNWSVDTTADHDLVPGDNGNSSECDDDRDCTYAGWRVAFPTFEVDPTTDNIWGAEFLPNTELTITVGGVTVPGGPYSTGEEGGFGDGWDRLPVDVAPGTVVTVSDGETTKAHTVSNLAVTSVDVDTNIVAGTATPDAMIQVEIHGLLSRMVTADSAGNWSVDFSDEHDLVPGEAGEANEFDPDGDSTHAFWRAVNPLFWVDPADESVSIADFLPVTELTITVNDNPVPGGPYVTDELGNSGAGFDPAELNLAADDVVVISDGESTKTHTVTKLAITGADPDTNEVLGVAAPGSSVHVWVHDPDVQRNVVAGPDRGDGLGEWVADFTAAGIIEPGDQGTADLDLNSNGNSIQCDADEDCTNAFWRVRNPTFSVETPSSVWSSNPDWELGDTITLTIDDPSFPGPLTTTVVSDEGGPENHWRFDLDVIFEIQPGHVVTVTDGDTTKTLTVLDLTIDAIDGENDTVSGRLLDGLGSPLPDVQVEVHVDSETGGSHRTVLTGADGYWVADFAAPGEGEGEESEP